MQEIDPRFADVAFCVEADCFTYNALWNNYSTEGIMGYLDPNLESNIVRVKWERDAWSKIYTVGTVKKLPVNIDCRWATINGQRVLFYDACGMVAHWKMIEDFLEKHCPNASHRRSASNFFNVLHEIERMNKKK